MLVFDGTYTEPILFGTGKTLEGKGEGIYVFRFDETSGRLDPLVTVAGVVNPSYLALDPRRRFLYAVNEQKVHDGRPGGAVSAFALDATHGELTFLNRKPTYGTDPCHLVVDATGRYVLVANFASGSVCVLPVGDDGALGEATDFVAHVGYGIAGPATGHDRQNDERADLR